MELNKRLDQFFLEDESILSEEIETAKLTRNDIVLEIGAGDGRLTRKIAERCMVIAIEIDKRFAPQLKKISNAEVIFDNALKILRQKREGKIDVKFNKIVSNIPYSISKKIVLEILKHEWDTAVLIVQKEFAQKITSGSRLSLLIEDCCLFEIVGYIPAGAFTPPAADSALIRLKQKKVMDKDFWNFINKLYNQKNKNLRNVVEKCPEKYAKMKVHQLSFEEIREIYSMNRD